MTPLRTRLAVTAVVALAAFAAGYAVHGSGGADPARPTDPADASAEQVTDAFHDLYYLSGEHTWNNTYWLGIQTLKCPLDLWIYQEILHDLQPDVIVEAGTYNGGSAFYMASILDSIGKGRIITIDIEDFPGKPQHDRITYLLGSSTSDEVVDRVKSLIAPDDTVMVVLDSDHHAPHVLNELRIYSQIVTPGSYIVAEDTNVNGHPVLDGYGPGPMEALNTFLAENDDFESDRAREKFLLTFNPRGFLRRVR